MALGLSVPSKFSPIAKMPEIVRTFYTQRENAENWSQKKKKGHHADGGIFFSDLMLISKKKKVLRLSSSTFLLDFCDIPERGAVNRSCLRFLAGNKNAGFWREKKRWNSQNFGAKMSEKISHFFALVGNTAWAYFREMYYFDISKNEVTK